MASVKKLDLDGAKSPDFADSIVGIDLGTTNSAASIYSSGLVPNMVPIGARGKHTIQSCVRWDGGDKFTVGEEAYVERYKPNVIYSVKRMMGSGKTITLTRDDGSSITLSPAEVSSKILGAIKEKLQSMFPGIKKCIITVPAYFDQLQIKDTLEAAKLADLDCLQILKEPTSASYIYSVLGHAQDGSVLIYDLGGGTFDITCLTFFRKSAVPSTLLTSIKKQYDIDAFADDTDDSPYYCRVLGTYGDTHLGGDDIDAEMCRLVLKEAGNPKLPVEELERLKLACEDLKKCDEIAGREFHIKGQDIVLNLTRDQLNRAVGKVFDKTMKLMEQIPLDDLRSVSTIVLVGGSTKSNHLVDLLVKAFPDKEISRVLDPDATVALGAGIVAKDLQEGKGVMYQDVLPMPIGVLVGEESIDVCVPRNTPLPYSSTRTYHTMYDNQDALSVQVYQGVSKDPKKCVYLGLLRVANLPHKPAGELDIHISFILDAQGRLRIVTNIDGVEEPRELLIESIFDVNKVEENVDDLMAQLDDFERGVLDLVVGRQDLTDLLLARRDAIEEGDEDKASALADQIMEAL